MQPYHQLFAREMKTAAISVVSHVARAIERETVWLPVQVIVVAAVVVAAVVVNVAAQAADNYLFGSDQITTTTEGLLLMCHLLNRARVAVPAQ